MIGRVPPRGTLKLVTRYLTTLVVCCTLYATFHALQRDTRPLSRGTTPHRLVFVCQRQSGAKEELRDATALTAPPRRRMVSAFLYENLGNPDQPAAKPRSALGASCPVARSRHDDPSKKRWC